MSRETKGCRRCCSYSSRSSCTACTVGLTIDFQVLYNLQKSGAKTFLLTNSGWEYTNQVKFIGLLMREASQRLSFWAWPIIEANRCSDINYDNDAPGHGLLVEFPWCPVCWTPLAVLLQLHLRWCQETKLFCWGHSAATGELLIMVIVINRTDREWTLSSIGSD